MSYVDPLLCSYSLITMERVIMSGRSLKHSSTLQQEFNRYKRLATNIIHHVVHPICFGHCLGGSQRPGRRKNPWRPSLSNAKWMKIRWNFYIEILGLTCCERGGCHRTIHNSVYRIIRTIPPTCFAKGRNKAKIWQEWCRDCIAEKWYGLSIVHHLLHLWCIQPSFPHGFVCTSWPQEFTAQADKTDLILKKASHWHALCHVAGDFPYKYWS